MTPQTRRHLIDVLRDTVRRSAGQPKQLPIIIAASLGRPSAEHLAHQITQLLHPPPLAKTGPTE